MKIKKFIKRDYLFKILIGIGLVQSIGYVFNSPSIMGLGVVSCISPLPTVFSKIRGIEAFSSTYWIEYENQNKPKQILKITPEVYSHFSFSYNLKNVYSIDFGYLPTFPNAMNHAVMQHAFFKKKIFAFKGVNENSKNITFHIQSHAKGLEKTWVYKLN